MPSPLASLPIAYCSTCETIIPDGETVVLEGCEVCAPCALTDAAHSLSALLYPMWSTLPSSVRTAEEALRAIRPLLARVEARVKAERRKSADAAADDRRINYRDRFADEQDRAERRLERGED